MKVQRSFGQSGHTNAGTLYLVGTPIGNLEDMTFRAVRVLKEVDWIAAEDTRQTRKLLTHFDITTRLVSYHEHNKRASGPELIRNLKVGLSIALVSDAGMPAISDPGYDLVRLAIEEDIAVVPVPGANAALCTLIVSGLPTERFLFAGFLPRDRKPLRAELDRLRFVEATVLLYESPHRVLKTLEAIHEAWGDRPVCLMREISKRYEEALRGTIVECLAYLAEHEPVGEYVIAVGGAEGSEEELAAREGTAWWQQLTAEAHVARYEEQGLDRKEAMKRAAADRGVSKRDIYNELLQS
ncbi:16S rRNA (cytidine(1402)-2'-O)-methyltransferase [Paenibacillus koleovorans]|uniref:16S rRNA (cytidine(1402)-2'-O)-methyltransferase n=1 Tax=Paenibacillus koleovorans TaxID=121608 RepID=UPI000FDC52D9|nr:16S rRNA (cytidine(1402)-2'-O)-methyltransferase [Paenibacillus koleovorans]